MTKITFLSHFGGFKTAYWLILFSTSCFWHASCSNLSWCLWVSFSKPEVSSSFLTVIDRISSCKLSITNCLAFTEISRSSISFDVSCKITAAMGSLFVCLFGCFESRSGYKERPLDRFSPSPSIVWRSVFCDREIDEFSYSAFIYRPHSQSHFDWLGRRMIKVAGAGIELELHSSSWPFSERLIHWTNAPSLSWHFWSIDGAL